MSGKITIIGLGPGSVDDISLGSMKKMKSSSFVYLRTKSHPCVSELEDMGIEFNTFDWLYEECKDFQEVYGKIAQKVISKAKDQGEVVYAVPGHPLVAEESVEQILAICKKQEDITLEILPAMSFIDAIINSLQIDPIHGLKIIDGLQIDSQACDTKIGNLITQVYSSLVASEIKLKLMEYYKDETMIWVVRAAGVKDLEKIRHIPLYQLDRLDGIDYLTSVYIPPVGPEDVVAGQAEDLVDIMKTLRSDTGCPWDREQDHESLKQYLIEESYEVIDAINRGSMVDLEEELGDVLLQVVFHAQIAKENQEFDFRDIVRGICNKLIFRHPHIFSNEKADTSEEVISNWEELKKIEKGMDNQTEVLKAVPNSLPALMRAYKIQKKAADVGFDWIEIEDVLDKIKEEFNELKEVYLSSNQERIIEELGDLFFSTVNLARFLKIQPELALGKTTEKFINRFSYMEENARKINQKLEEMSLEEMEKLWNEAKGTYL